MAALEQIRRLRSAGHRLTAKRVIAPEDVSDETLVIFPRSVNPRVYDSLLAALEAAGYRFRDDTT
jgi:hypothetical protein